jgi:cell division transport system ATP-binding protein
LLADEPTGNLDEDMATEIVDVIKDIWSRGTTVLFSTHQTRLVADLRRRTLRIQGGRLLKDEPAGFLPGGHPPGRG